MNAYEIQKQLRLLETIYEKMEKAQTPEEAVNVMAEEIKRRLG